jgi:hypothetical protein
MTILNLGEAPREPIERLAWLSGVKQQALEELDAEFQRTYFDARAKGMMRQALALRLHARKRAFAFTRAENEARGRVVRRWADDY